MASSANASPLLTPTEAWSIAVVATLVMTVSYVDRQTFAALSPTVCDALAITQTQYGWLSAAFSIAYLVGAPVAGWIVDQSGARTGLLRSVLVWSAVSALHAFAPSFALLFGLRIALGAAESPSFPAAAQAVRRTLPARHQSAGFGLLFTGSSIGAMFAAPLAIAFNRHMGWRFAFLGTAAVGLLWVPLWAVVTRSSVARATLAAPITSSFAPKPGTRDALASLGRLVLQPVVLRAVVLVVATAPVMNFVFNWLPKFMVAERGLTQDALAAYLWVPPLFFDAGAVTFGIVASLRDGGRRRGRVPRDMVALAGLLCATLALMPLARGPWSVIAIASVALIGGGGCFALLTADMLARVDPAHVSAAGGLTAAAQSFAYIFANVLVGVVLDRTHSYAGVLEVLGIAVVPGTIAWLVWPTEPRTAHA